MNDPFRIWDIAVIGAGVVGLSCAFQLARDGFTVAVVESERPGSGASSVAAGVLSARPEPDPTLEPLVALQLDSLKRYPQFIADVEAASGMTVGYRTEGSIWIALDESDQPEWERLLQLNRARKLPVERLDADQVRALEPCLSEPYIGGLHLTGEAQVDPRRLLPALERAVGSLGVSIITGWSALHAVRDISSRPRIVRIRIIDGYDRSSVQARRMIITAGHKHDELLNFATEPSTSLVPIGTRGVKGQILSFQGPRILNHVIKTRDVLMVPRDTGELIVGATIEEGTSDPTPDPHAAADLLRATRRVMPRIDDFELGEHRVGFRPAVQDNLPAIGRKHRDSVWVANGHYRNGIQLAPATAYWLARAIRSGRPSKLIKPFALDRLTPASEEDRR
ncbi:MAG: glycine oxidase ThiO [Chloroflexi bacterium]|nr:glycine oxidase ThiO [Chloroflexota bacterium]MCY3696720.1 glycine oxidase ThiO [Chloroflexota bacterium]